MDFVDGTLADFADNDLRELWDSDYYADALKTASLLPPWTKEALRAASELDWSGVLESSPAGGGGSSGGGNVVLNDRLMTEASLGVISQLSNLGSLGTLGSLGNLSTLLAQHQQEGMVADTTTTGGPIVKTEHSYSIDTERPDSAAAAARIKTDTTDIENECFPAIPISEAEGTSSCSNSTTSTVDSPMSSDEDEDSSSNSSFIITTSTTNTPSISSSLASSLASLARKVSSASTSSGLDSLPTFTTNSIKSEFPSTSSIINVPSIKTSIGLARPAAVVVTQRSCPSRGSGTNTRTIHTTIPSPSRNPSNSLTLRLSSAGSSPTSSDTGFSMPPTPPSCSGSDSEYGGSSPTRTTPLYEHLTPQFCNPRKSCTRITVSSRNPINTPLISTQPKGVTGPVNLTEEEKRTLISEGYTVPARLPLTKTEEKSLKKIRRKIKNKISAQESRRKKKEYMDALERKVESISQDNLEYKRRLEALQTSNSQLLVELHRLQAAVAQDEKSRRRATTISTTTN